MSWNFVDTVSHFQQSAQVLFSKLGFLPISKHLSFPVPSRSSLFGGDFVPSSHGSHLFNSLAKIYFLLFLQAATTAVLPAPNVLFLLSAEITSLHFLLCLFVFAFVCL